jgi:helix-turn-helix resolvase-like protein
MADDYDDHEDIGWFRDQLRQRDRDIAELRREKDEQADQIKRFDEYVESHNSVIEQWRQAFDMELGDDGKWSWDPFVRGHWELVDQYNQLVRKWNKFVPEYNATVAKQPVGRPLAASEAQIKTVTKLHKQGKSLGWIVEETNLSLRTVRTIVGRLDGTDRTTQKRRERVGLERIAVDKAALARWKRQRRTGDALPKQVEAVIETGLDLVKQAKGLR